jgi:hypothetical protein
MQDEYHIAACILTSEMLELPHICSVRSHTACNNHMG